MMPFNSLDVASFIATVCNEQGFHYNNTKIQKLLYCCYGGVLAVYNQRLCDECLKYLTLLKVSRQKQRLAKTRTKTLTNLWLNGSS